MSEADAKIYARDSYYADRVFYHGTNRNGANSIANEGLNPARFDELSTYGPGFYVGSDRNIAMNYAEETAQQGAVLSVRLNVRRPKIFANGVEYTRAVNDFIRQSGNINEEWNVAFNNYLRQQGYDAIELSETGYTVVFSREQVVTIGNEVVR
jgi:ADP-Ribosyltransferase in polyvalent proteins